MKIQLGQLALHQRRHSRFGFRTLRVSKVNFRMLLGKRIDWQDCHITGREREGQPLEFVIGCQEDIFKRRATLQLLETENEAWDLPGREFSVVANSSGPSACEKLDRAQACFRYRRAIGDG